MHPPHESARVGVTLIAQRRAPLWILRELWWRHERRRRIAQLSASDRRHALDKGYVVDAMARQLEEIRNLPELTH